MKNQTNRFWELLRGAMLFVFVWGLSGCAGSLSQPFDAMKAAGAPVTAFRLQNYVPPPPAPNATPQGAQLPPQIQQWIQQGAAMLPPGLLPPGLIPGASPVPQPAQANVPRFHEFPIIQGQDVVDSKTKGDIWELFGKEDNFVVPRETCMFAEFGFTVPQMNQPPADILVSLSCNQVQTFGFAWPHGAKRGITPETAKKIIAIMQKTFGG